MPTELDELRRRVMQLEIEEEALKKEEDRSEQRTAGASAGRAGRSERGVCGQEGAVG